MPNSEDRYDPGLNVGKMDMRDMLQTLTGGRPFVFMIMGYNSRWSLYERVKKIAGRQHLACIRADDLKTSGHDLLNKIHFLITRAELVVAEISDASPNVFYEIGYSVGIQRYPILLLEKGGAVPTDLKGMEFLEYKMDTEEQVRTFEYELAGHLRSRLSSDLALVRDMIEPPAVSPIFIVASPKYPGVHSRIIGQVFDRRTFGDHLGILGLISAFGSIWGHAREMDLISAQHGPKELLELPLNQYHIGSDKTNRYTGDLLREVQGDQAPHWRFGPIDGSTEEDEDWQCMLYRDKEAIRGRTKPMGEAKQDIWVEDYGIIVRGPNPHHPNRLLMLLAGAHSLGTGAACLAATHAPLIKQIRDLLPGNVLEDKTCGFWVLVKAKVNEDDHLLDAEGVTIEEVGVYDE